MDIGNHLPIITSSISINKLQISLFRSYKRHFFNNNLSRRKHTDIVTYFTDVNGSYILNLLILGSIQ